MIFQNSYSYEIIEEEIGASILCKISSDERERYRIESLDNIDEKELIELFWREGYMKFEEKLKLVTYLNKKGHGLKLFKGERINGAYKHTHCWDGISWNEHVENN